MLTIDASKNKKLHMVIEASGIENDKLRFTFVIDTGKVQYGFPCLFYEGKVEINLPPLEEVIKDLKPGQYKARLDVTGDDKYYINPFNETVDIKLSPQIKKAELQEELDEGITMAVTSLFEIDDEKKKDEPLEEDKEKDEKKDKKRSGISSFFDKKK